MPYITPEKRSHLDLPLERLMQEKLSDGELNYVITKLCVNFLNNHELKYSTLNTIIGVLECAKQEFYRRVCRPYEDEKSIKNGDVY